MICYGLFLPLNGTIWCFPLFWCWADMRCWFTCSLDLHSRNKLVTLWVKKAHQEYSAVTGVTGYGPYCTGPENIHTHTNKFTVGGGSQ